MKKAYDVKKSLLLALPLLFGSVAHADDNFTVLGDEMTCSRITKYISSDEPMESMTIKIVVKYYFEGFWSAYNTAEYMNSKQHIPSNIGRLVSNEFMINYAKEYCLQHPEQTLPFVAAALTKDIADHTHTSFIKKPR
ncbi:hypothetical protein M2305_003259 [Gluconobacter cerinus]|uniref:hypothetical protein n=1 Tax=Gluconobacter cerinus TaxID=38307 RepID=UPI0022266023|nr:hypothetical protein [Gluconobacter cerinus]MCW2267240.1 hypothetical protein [Gluconobacter cerinus]